MILYRLILLLSLLSWAVPAALSAATFEPENRIILAFYNGENEEGYTLAPVHQNAEMPLNNLGLTIRHLPAQGKLPALSEMGNVRGILIWFDYLQLDDPVPFIQWCIRAMRAGKRLVHMGPIVLNVDKKEKLVPVRLLKTFWNLLGLDTDQDWLSNTHNLELTYHDRTIVPYERDYQGGLAEYQPVYKVRKDVRPILTAQPKFGEQRPHILAAVSKNGGFVAEKYAFFHSHEEEIFRQWHINPFRFFRDAFATHDIPKPDNTTLSGRRIYYSHIDGDAWRSETRVKKYQKKGLRYVSDVILEEVVKGYPDLPLTIAPVVADLDPSWFGRPKFIKNAREIFSYDHIEAGSHTYSHPLQWSFFEKPDPEAELPYLHLYPKKEQTDMMDYLLRSVGLRKNAAIATPDSQGWKQVAEKALKKKKADEKRKVTKLFSHYSRPRAFAVKPFDLQLEMQGSFDFINTLLPGKKRTEVLQWSGNCVPFEAAVRATREAGVRNLNGGDTRFDPEFPSVAWVSPFGRYVGKETQVYASSSNENTYTDLWTDRFFGFMHLVETMKNTETPKRLQPMNIYYHMYSGERVASVNALLHNLNYARSRPLAPVTTSQFAAITDGAMVAKLYRKHPDVWRIENHGDLGSIRFDDASLKRVDLANSTGVLGYRHHQGSLYVSLDRAVAKPVISIGDNLTPHKLGDSTKPYLIEARWWVSHLKRKGPNQLGFKAQGFGDGEMQWKMATPGQYDITMTTPEQSWNDQLQIKTDSEGVLNFTLPAMAIHGVEISIEKAEQRHPAQRPPRRREAP
ncbi:polysaccharide deacetylase family protein [Magnetococcus sp. PR-3]|uniref:polysaccharide deacetylase family protein n=1 Tax=Magnetococcus sp. PR-3 TaxID=3120355 RepID=UPI002FCE5F5C